LLRELGDLGYEGCGADLGLFGGASFERCGRVASDRSPLAAGDESAHEIFLKSQLVSYLAWHETLVKVEVFCDELDMVREGADLLEDGRRRSGHAVLHYGNVECGQGEEGRILIGWWEGKIGEERKNSLDS
jgi:hypothetical protein